ncbi:MAG TPA: NADH-quinone oxidoreductase subunit F, partial [bacterium]|nr:NADH-quinone oxidoreductase subunit F [bacterium]
MKHYRAHIFVCAGTGCVSNGSFKIKDVLKKELKKHGLEEEIRIGETACNGFCDRGPIIVVQPEGIYYHRLTEEDIPLLVAEHFLKGQPVERLIFTPPEQPLDVPLLSDVEFFKHQRLIVLKNRGRLDPEKIDEYIAMDGYAALAKAVTEFTPEQIINEIKDSGLRGRGGGGFPTGIKWQLCREQPKAPKYIICNADEGDPGAFMDRSILESDPHAVLE